MVFGAAVLFASLLLPQLSSALSWPQTADGIVTVERKATPMEALAAAFEELEASKTEVSSAAVESIRNDLLNGGCGDIIVIFARGTSARGNVGVPTSVGPMFFSNSSAVEPGRVIAQGVNDYPADV